MWLKISDPKPLRLKQLDAASILSRRSYETQKYHTVHYIHARIAYRTLGRKRDKKLIFETHINPFLPGAAIVLPLAIFLSFLCEIC